MLKLNLHIHFIKKGSFLLFFILFQNAYSQTGPGGVGSSSSNVMWLKSEDLTLLSDGDNISSWADASGNGNAVSQPTPSFTPVFKTNILNGFPAVRFEKANGRLRKTGFTSFPTSAITAIYVNKNSESGDGVLSYASSANNNDFLLYGSNSLGFYRGGSSVNSGIAFDDNSFHITNASRQSSDGSVEIWKDGSRDYTGILASGSSVTAGGSLAIAGEQDAVDANYQATQAHFGDFTEVMVFNTFLNQAQQIIVSNYLSAKYAISITNDRFTYQNTHSHNVAGIGRENATNTHLSAMSDAILQIQNASGIDADQEYLLFGHDDADITTNWTTTEAPESGVNIQRLEREWRLDETGDVGTIDFVVDVASFPTLPVDHTMYALMVDSDGDFSTGASVYELTLVSGTEYSVTGIDISDGDFISIAAVNPKIQHTNTANYVAESTATATIEISLNFIPQTDKTVQFTTANGSATAGSDYTAATSSTATIFAGNKSANYNISITNDVLIESTETFTSTLSSPIAGVTLGTNTIFTYSLNDDDNPRKVYFNNATDSNSESTTSVTVNLSINNVDLVNPTNVDYAISGGTATAGGIDFTLASGTVTFPTGTSTNSFTFTVNNDVLKETNETITVALSNPINCNLDTILPTEYTYTITDDDPDPEIQFTNVATAGSESLTTVNFQVNLNTAAGTNVMVNYSVSGTATGTSTDYALVDGTATITAGNTTTNITATIINDDEVELGETIVVTLSSPVNAVLGTNIVSTYTIADDDNFGYTGPGGVGDSDTNILWLDATDISSLADDDDLNAWSDTSGNSNDFSQNTTFSPVYKTSILNSMPSARFNKTNNRIRKVGFTGFAETAATAIFVNKNNSQSSDALLSYASTNSLNNDFLLFGSNSLALFVGNASINTGVSINDNNWHILNTSWQNSNGDVSVWKDGTETFTGTHAAGVSIGDGGTLAIAGEQDTVDGGYAVNQAHAGDFPEVIMYNTFLNDAQQIIVANYLSAKYNISIANDFYTQDDSGDFDFNVAGIGKATDGSFHIDSKGKGIIRINTPSSLSDDDFLFWGENVKDANYDFSPSAADNYIERLDTKWRVSKRNNLGTVSVSVDVSDITLNADDGCNDLKLIVSSSSTFTTKTTYNLALSGGVYTASNVSFNDGDYFTIEYTDTIVFDASTAYNGSGTANIPNITNDCFKLLVKNTANGTITISEDADVREIEVETGGILAVENGIKLKVTNGIINNGDIRLIGTSQLVQTHTGTSLNTGSGNLYVDQNASTANVYNSGYWSSPVRKSGTVIGTDYTINDVLKDGSVPISATSTIGEAIDIDFIAGYDGDNASSPIKISERWLATLINAQEFTLINATDTDLSPGMGWNMKSVGASFTFKGIPNDGTYTTSIDKDNYSLLGNPYPSALDSQKFIDDNATQIKGTIYIYNSGTGDTSHVRSEYTNGYSTIVSGVTIGTGRYLPIGQAFFVTREDLGSGTIMFQNSQRLGIDISNTSSIIAKSSSSFPILRLGFEFDVDETLTYNRSLAVAFRGLTSGYENSYDGEMFDKKASDLNLKLEGSENPYVISSIEDFNEDLEIPLGLVLDRNRTVTFKIDALENFPDTDVYINDRLEDTFYPISEEQTVTLNLSQGNYNDRFFITFNNKTLANSVTEKTSNSIKIITKEDKKIVVKNTSNLFLNTIKIYDLLGKQIFNSELQSNISEYTIDLENKSPAIYIVVINSKNGLIRKKIILD